jgi:hypothetical protein
MECPCLQDYRKLSKCLSLFQNPVAADVPSSRKKRLNRLKQGSRPEAVNIEAEACLVKPITG